MTTSTPRPPSQGRRFDAPGDNPVGAPVVCVITRFGLRSVRYLLPMYLNYRRVVKAATAAKTPGLLRAAFLIENPRTCYSVSIWAGDDAIPRFGANVPAHVVAARQGFGWVRFREGRGPEVWSTKWRLASVSNNLSWEEFDLRGLLLQSFDQD